MNAQGRLLSRFTETLPPGKLEWIGLRTAHKGPMTSVSEVMALAGQGLEGDHRCQGRSGSARQVTLISREYIAMIAHFLRLQAGHQASLFGIDALAAGDFAIAPEQLRRNLVVSGINLTALRHQRFRIGTAEFEATALCHPCSRMEKTLGEGGVAAMLGHGGLCARITQGGLIRCADAVIKLPA